MRRWFPLVAAGVVGVVGCAITPKRQMRQPTSEELMTPAPGLYTTTPDLPRDQPLLTPKTNTPSLNNSPVQCNGSSQPTDDAWNTAAMNLSRRSNRIA